MDQLPVHVPQSEFNQQDYDYVKFLGKGAYSEVVLAKSKITGHCSALKIIDKNFLIKEKKSHHVYIEKEVLGTLRHPGIIKLFNAFESEDKLYFSLELLNDGNLLEYTNKNQLGDSQIKFYTAELLVILEYIHQNGLVHRDVKPENILLTKDKHLKLIDFATILVFDSSKLEIGPKLQKLKEKHRRKRGPSFDAENLPNYRFCKESSFVGTSEYLCPELVDHSISGPQADLWALGCFIYQLYTHTTPFQNDNEFWLFHNISQAQWKTQEAIPDDALDLIKILLSKNPECRFNGEINEDNYSYCHLKSHRFFQGIDFDNMWLQDVPKLPHVQQGNSFRRKQNRFITTMVEQEREKEHERGNSNSKYKADQVIMKGVIEKEHGILFFQQFSPRSISLLVQGGLPYLIYINPQLNNKQTTILLNHCTQCKLLDEGKFILVDKNKKKYIFKEKKHSIAKEWVDNINKLIQTYLL